MINKNHMEMCRFTSRDDDGYEKFLVALRDYKEAIKGIKPEPTGRFLSCTRRISHRFMPFHRWSR